MKEEKRKKILKISGLAALFLIVFGLSYALFTVTLNGTKKVKIKTGKLELQLLDSSNNPIYSTSNNSVSTYEINLDNQVPVDDETGLATAGFTFKLKNIGSVDARYTIYLDDVALESGESRIDDGYVKYALTKNGTTSTPALVSSMVVENERELDKGIIANNNTTNEYTLKIWIDEEATNAAMDKVFNATLRVEGVQYVAPAAPFTEGTFAATIYNKGVVGEYNSTTQVPNGFNSETEESGLYKYTDSEGTVTYSYRGLPEDNYVTFAGQTWRILRIQEDGTVKLISENPLNYENTDYDDGSRTENGVTYRMILYNNTASSEDDNKYEGSNIKSYVDAWYNNTMTSYDSKIATNNYCSDRYEDNSNMLAQYMMQNFNLSKVYGIYARGNISKFAQTANPFDGKFAVSLNCESGDVISSKAALLTIEEYVLAGGILSPTNNGVNNYLVDEYYYWTMSPAGFSNRAKSFVVYINGKFDSVDVNEMHIYGGVRPVITLKATISPSSGDGTELTPYVID